MASYPPGLQTRVVTFGPLLDFQGRPINDDIVTVRAERSFFFDGKTFLRAPMEAKFTGGTATLELPCVDQPGLTDGVDGNTISGWTYTAEWPELDPGMDQPEDSTFTLLTTDVSKTVGPDLSMLRTAGVIDLVPGSMAQVRGYTDQAVAAAAAAYASQIAAGSSQTSALAAAAAALAAQQEAERNAANTTGRIARRTDPLGILAAGRPYFVNAYQPGDLPNDGAPGGVTWANITSKPSTFPPEIGSGAAQAVAGNDARLTNSRTPTAHTHPQSDVVGLVAKLANIDSALEEKANGTDLADFMPKAGGTFTAVVKGVDPSAGTDLATKQYVDAQAVGGTGTIPDATDSLKGKVQLPGNAPGVLGGPADAPTVTGWADKASQADLSALTTTVGTKAATSYVDTQLATKASTTQLAAKADTSALAAKQNTLVVPTSAPGSYVMDGTLGFILKTALPVTDAGQIELALRNGGGSPSRAANWTGAQLINASDQGWYIAATLDGNVTLSFSGTFTTGWARTITLELIQGTGGSKLVTWPTQVKWDDALGAPVLPTAAGKSTLVTLVRTGVGTRWLGVVGALSLGA